MQLNSSMHNVQAHCIGVDEFLALCKHWKRLCDKFPDDWTPKPGEPNARRVR